MRGQAGHRTPPPNNHADRSSRWPVRRDRGADRGRPALMACQSARCGPAGTRAARSWCGRRRGTARRIGASRGGSMSGAPTLRPAATTASGARLAPRSSGGTPYAGAAPRRRWWTISCRIAVTAGCSPTIATGSRCASAATTARRPRGDRGGGNLGDRSVHRWSTLRAHFLRNWGLTG